MRKNIKKFNVGSIFLCGSVALALYAWSAQPATAIGEPCTLATVESDCFEGQTCAGNQCKWMEGYLCNNATECASGICQSVSGSLRCGCTRDDECIYVDQHCETTTHRCVTATERWGGEPCSSNAECSSGECRSGTCTCRNNDDCPEARFGTQICQAGACVRTAAQRCTQNADCATGICLTERGTCGCRTDADCTGGGTCQDGECIIATTTFTTLEDVSKLKKISAANVPQLVGSILKTTLGLTGSIALLFFVYAGILWLTSGGNPDKIKKAQQIMVWAVIGLFVIFASYVIVDKVIKTLGG